MVSIEPMLSSGDVIHASTSSVDPAAVVYVISEERSAGSNAPILRFDSTSSRDGTESKTNCSVIDTEHRLYVTVS